MRTKAIHISLKAIMRSKGKTYADAAKVLDLSEGSVKRLFSTGGLSLQRLETLCNWIGTDIKEVIVNAERQQPHITQLTLDQENELVDDPRLLLVTFLVLNNWKEHEIKAAFDYTEPELNIHFAKLERIGLIELLPFNRMHLLTARNFQWSENGPVRSFFAQNILPQFIQGGFTQPGEKMHFMGGMLSEKSIFVRFASTSICFWSSTLDVLFSSLLSLMSLISGSDDLWESSLLSESSDVIMDDASS